MPHMESRNLLTLGLLLILLSMLYFTIVFTSYSFGAVPPEKNWSQTYGYPFNSEEAFSVVQKADGGYAIAGSNGTRGLLVVTDAVGNVTIPIVELSFNPKSIVSASDGGFVIAGQGLAVKLDPTGALQWSADIAGVSRSIIRINDGGYVTIGYAVLFGGRGFLILKLSPTGSEEWQYSSGILGSEGASVIQTSDGDLVIAGYRTANLTGADFSLMKVRSSDGGLLWEKTYDRGGDEWANSLIQTSDGGFVLAGSTSSNGGDLWIVKTDSSGNMEWDKTYGGSLPDSGKSVVQARAGGYAVAGSTSSYGSGEEDAWLIRTDSNGNVLWNVTFGGIDNERANSLIQTSDGGFVLAGYSSYNGGDFWVIKTDAEDVTPPDTYLNLSGVSGENGWYVSDVLVNLTAADDLSLSDIRYRLDSGAWQVYSLPADTMSTSGSVSFDLTSEGEIIVSYSSRDISQNVESTNTTAIRIDKNPPVGTITINDYADESNTTDVRLSLSANDITSGIWQMRFSNNGNDYSAWQTYDESAQWTLQYGEGSKTVYAEFRDYAGLTSISSDSIELVSIPAVRGGFPIEYVVASVAAATAAAGIAVYVIGKQRKPKLREEETQRAPPPLFAKLRWIQGQVFEVLSKDKIVRLKNALHANALHNIVVRIGPADQDWLTPVEGQAFPEDKLVWKDGFSSLQVIFSEPNHAPIPQVGKIMLPREGASTACQFSFTPRADVPQFRGRVIVSHENRVIQTALLEGNVVSDPNQVPDMKLKFGIESVIQPNLGDLSSREPFDLSFVANHATDNSRGLTTIATEQAFFNRLTKVEVAVKEITSLLENVVKYPEEYPKSIEDKKNVNWLRDLALNGKDLYDGIVVDQIGKDRLTGINRVQLISTVDEYLPLEFIYDMPAPKHDASLCPKWREALKEGRCKSCEIKGTFAPADFLCPIGFWGLRIIIERHYLDPYDKPDLKGYAFALRGESVEGRRVLRILKSAVFASSNKVDEVMAQSKEVFKVLERVTRHKAEQVTTLESWKEAIMRIQPSLIVLLTHISPYKRDPRQAQMEIGKGVGLPRVYITSQYLLPSDDAPRPVVLLLGCTTMSTSIPFRSFATSFRRQGAAIVLSTITEVLGRHVAPVSAQLVSNLEKAAQKGLSLGDALVLVRRKALADGVPMVLSLVGIGDADWRFETLEGD
jgi:hypothetical protein